MTTADDLREEMREEQDTIKGDKLWAVLKWLWAFIACLAIACGDTGPLDTISTAYAADKGCGRDTDNNGVVDKWCTSGDQDNDGFLPILGAHPFTGEQNGLDCDDQDANVFPGVITNKECAAGSYHTCQGSTGTYTACKPLSTFAASDCGSGYTNIYFFDPTLASDTGSGTFASPWNLLAISKTSMATYHAPTAGDCLVVLGTGNFTQTWTDVSTVRMLYTNGKSGTAANPIKFWMVPGAAIVGQGVSPTEVLIFQQDSCDYWNFQGFSANSGYSTTGLYVNGGSNVDYYLGDIHGLRGNSNQNVAGFKQNGGSFVSYRNSLGYDNYDATTIRAQDNNTACTAFFQGSNNKQNFNVCYSTPTNGEDNLLKYKHSGRNVVAGNQIIGNILYDAWGTCIESNQQQMVISHNYMNNCTQARNAGAASNSFVLHDLGDSGSVFRNIRASYNTIELGGGIEVNRNNDQGLATMQYWDTSPRGSFEIDHNTYSDNRATAYQNDGLTGVVRLCHYCTMAEFALAQPARSILFHDNCWYNSAGTALFFDVAGAGAGGSAGTGTYSGVTAWKAAGYDSGALNQDPATGCAGMGWQTPEYGSGRTTNRIGSKGRGR